MSDGPTLFDTLTAHVEYAPLPRVPYFGDSYSPRTRTIPLSDPATEMLGVPRQHVPRATARPSWVQDADDSITGRWWSFHQRHPEVYGGLVHLARQAKRKGAQRLAIAMVFEVLRWNTMMGADVPSEEPFRLNNSYRSSYSRFIQQTCPDLDGFFMTRAAEADG